MKKQFIFILSLIFAQVTSSQSATSSPDGKVNQIQPKIMVIPFTRESEDIRTVIDTNTKVRIAINKVKEAFDKRGFTTVDFLAKLKAAKETGVFTSENKMDIKTQIIQFSGADIYVMVDLIFTRTSTGNSVSLNLSGNEASTGNSIANKTGTTNKFYTEDINMLSQKAAESIADEFLDIMQTKFNDIVENGKSITVNISFSSNAIRNMDSELGPSATPLADLLRVWMSENAYKGVFNDQGYSSNLYNFSDVRIPLKNQTNGRNYTTGEFALLLYNYIKSLGLSPKKSVQLNKIYITIN